MPRRRMFAAAFAVLLAALLTAVAACGGGSGGAGAGAEGAGLVSADTAVFLAVDTDFESEQWQAAEALLARFPSGGVVADELLEGFAADGIDVERDLKPALGPETDLAILELTDETSDQDLVLLTKPADPEKLEELLVGADDAPVWRIVDGWYVVADTPEVLDRALGGEAKLADEPAFEEAMAGLPADSLARLYVDGEAFEAAAGRGLAGYSLFGIAGSAGQSGALVSLAVAFGAEEAGVRIEGSVRTDVEPETASYRAGLPAVVPSGALLYVSFGDARAGLEQLLELVAAEQPDFDRDLAQVELVLGVSVEEDVLPLFEGENALYVRPGVPIPEVTLILSPSDAESGLATLDRLTAGIGALAALSGEEAQFTANDTTIAGVAAKELRIDEEISVYYGLVDGHIVVTTSVAGIADLVTGTSSLAGDPRFAAAAEAAGLPDESLGFVYVDVQGTIALAETLGELSEGFLPEEPAPEELAPLEYLLVYGAAEGRETTFSGFLGVGGSESG